MLTLKLHILTFFLFLHVNLCCGFSLARTFNICFHDKIGKKQENCQTALLMGFSFEE